MTPYPPQSMPWWKSKVIVGAAVSILTKLLVLTGLTGEFTALETQQIVDLSLIAIGAIGDLVAIGARVRQRYAPTITSGGGSGRGGATLSALLACALVIPLVGCSMSGLSGVSSIPSAPAELSDRTDLDERGALTITLAYTGTARAAAIAIETGFIDDAETVRRIGELDRKAYGAVKAAEAAYRAGNADSYSAALGEARAAVSVFLSSVQGDQP